MVNFNNSVGFKITTISITCITDLLSTFFNYDLRIKSLKNDSNIAGSLINCYDIFILLFKFLFGSYSFSIEEAMYFGCLNISKFLSSTSFKVLCFHSVTLDL